VSFSRETEKRDPQRNLQAKASCSTVERFAKVCAERSNEAIEIIEQLAARQRNCARQLCKKGAFSAQYHKP
jgi:hypothetical protein